MRYDLVAVVIFAIFLGIYLRLPHRELDWQGTILPLAREFAGADPGSLAPLEGKVVVITGPTSGIGLGLARAYSKLGARIVAVARSQRKLENLQQEIPNVFPVQADFVDLDDVKNAAERIMDKFDHIDMLINNAGIFEKDFELHSTTKGHDRTFTVNYLSHFLLTEKLAPRLKNSTILQMSSSAHWAVDGYDLIPSDSEPPIASKPGGSSFAYRAWRAYGNSKFAQILHARALRKYNPVLENARIVAVCPGFVATQIVFKQDSFIYKIHSSLHYPMDGYGLTSSLLISLNSTIETDYYVNSAMTAFPPIVLPHLFSQLRIRDAIAYVGVLAFFWGQKAFGGAQEALSSPETYDEIKMRALYDWSLNEVSEYL